MHSTSAKDKRGDGRRECRTDLMLEDALTGSRLRATAFNYSKGGVCIQVGQPLWPGMQFWICTDIQPAGGGAGAGPAAVRWCNVVRTAGGPLSYYAGLQFFAASRRFRPGCRFRVISGGADQRRCHRL